MSPKLRLVLLSFLMLFVELALIRWTGSNVVFLSYFSNFVLLGSFLGIGIGFLRAGRSRNFFPYAPLALAGLVAFVRFFPVSLRDSGGDLIFFGELKPHGPPKELMLTVVFLVVAATMAFIGEGVARTFARFPPLEAYKWDLVGSLLGIAGFSALSFLGAPPLAWGAVAAAVFVAVELPPRVPVLAALQGAALIAILVMLGFESFAAGTDWSPYYKIRYQSHPVTENGRRVEPPVDFLTVDVNGVPHQADYPVKNNPIYQTLYQHARPAGGLGDVLVIGAGGGNDVAAALARGARHVDAVEIDRRLYELGKAHHPDRPYQDPRVSEHIDDGRAYLERTGRKYDLVILALPDSLTLVAGQSSLRLESYLFTKEAVEAARSRLRPGGVFSMYNYYREPWLLDRLGGTIKSVFGHPPCVHVLGATDGPNNFSVLTVGKDPSSVACGTDVRTEGALWEPSGAVPAPSTDDRPFPYLRGHALPNFYLITIALILLASLVLVRWAGGPMRPMVGYLDLFFMGAAFLLLETKNVVQFALLFGTTWFVNALVFAGVLLVVLLAVAVQRRVKDFRRPALLYLALLGALALAWLIPPHALLGLSVVPRFFAATALAFAPIFLANLVFTQRFKDTESSTSAFGANLLGAMVGGLLEYSALIVGYRSLLVVVAALYGLAFLAGRRYLVPGARAEAAPPRVAEPVPT